MTRLRRGEILTGDDEKYGRLRILLQNLIDTRHPYAKRMAERGIRAEHIKDYADLAVLPTTTKYDILNNYPKGWFAREDREIVRIQASSGVTGKPAFAAYTAGDIRMWSENMAWCMGLSGVNENDVVHVAFGYGLFTGGFGAHHGAGLLGAMVVPMSGGHTDRQVSIMKDLGATVLACTPSYALRIGEVLDEHGRDGLSLRLGFFGAEAWSDELRHSLEERLGLKALDMYGLSEAMGPGVSVECQRQDGLHISDDFIAETVDPDTLERVDYGCVGELVVTAWNKEAFPVIRYRTRDLTSLINAPCPCGEPTPRMTRVPGRSDDILILKGVNVFPTQIETAVCTVPGLTPHFQITVWRERGLQKINVVCERSPDTTSDDIARIQDELSESIKRNIGVTFPFEIAEPGAIPRSYDKAVRILKR
ncbi:MAG: phenylacetate--CoA ligase [Synergistaceae bacterium]|nr:phenylacetate--CoA ligase [Synergistaceae bacterium]